MSYRIVYGPMPKMKPSKRWNILRLQLLTAIFVMLFILAVKYGWPDGIDTIQSVLLPGEAGVTESAFVDMIDNLHKGQPMGEAVTAFCREVIDGAKEFD